VPKTAIVFYCENAQAPALQWLLQQPPKVQDKFDFLLGQLEERGSVLSRPHAAPLQQKIYELRARHQQVNYRLLYFFAGIGTAVVAHGCTKEAAVDASDIRRAVDRRTRYLKDPRSHTYRE